MRHLSSARDPGTAESSLATPRDGQPLRQQESRYALAVRTVLVGASRSRSHCLCGSSSGDRGQRGKWPPAFFMDLGQRQGRSLASCLGNDAAHRGLAWTLRKAQFQDGRRRDQRDLTVKTDLAFQTTMALHKPPSSRIRWTPRFDLFYSGMRALTILDIVPMAPARQTDKGLSIRFVRTDVSSYYKAYPTFGPVAQVQDETEDDFHNTEQWPMLIQPGQRLHIAVDQEFEIQLDGSAMSFDSDAEALEVLGLYFDLEPISGSYRPGTILLPTRVVCADSAWEMDVPYLIMPVGSTSLFLPRRKSPNWTSGTTCVDGTIRGLSAFAV